MKIKEKEKFNKKQIQKNMREMNQLGENKKFCKQKHYRNKLYN